MESLEQVIATIAKESDKSPQEIKELIEDKKTELSGLVSEEGAAYIVGRELGVSLLKEGRKRLKVKNLVGGMQSVEVVARVMGLSEVREFEREGKKGRVQSVTLGDETGVVRMPFWNQEIELLQSLEVKEGDVVSLTGGWVKMDARGSPELRLGRGKVEKSKEKIKVAAREEVARAGTAQRTQLAEAKEGSVVEVRGCMVQLFQKDPFFEVCPDCSKRVREEEGKIRCKEHGIVKPEHYLVISGVLDDGTGSIRVVFFRELAEQLFGEKVKGLKQIAEKAQDPLAVYEKFQGLGKDFLIRGRLKKNDFSGEVELVANEILEVDPRKEADMLLKSVERS